MNECVHCNASVRGALYKTYSPGNVSLTTCDLCGQVADPFVEQDWVLQSIDLALMKSSVLTHLLLNQGSARLALVLRLFALLLLMECFVRVQMALSVEPTLSPLLAAEAALINMLVRAAIAGLLSSLLCNALGLTFKRDFAAFSALVVGSVVPVSLTGLSIVWDYQTLWGRKAVLFGVMVASRATALRVVTSVQTPTLISHKVACHLVALALTIADL